MVTDTETASESTLSERRLAANRANVQLSTGPTTPEGKAVSSLNAVKTGLCGRAVLLADEDEARAYRKHVKRVTEWWNPDNVEEHALVQALADTQWRWEAIPGLESALYAQARLRGEPLLTHPDPTARRLLLDAQAEIAEAKALKNLRLHERRLRRQFEKDKAELNQLRNERLEREEAEREQKRRRRERRQAQEAAAPAAGGFEFTNGATDLEPPQEPSPDRPETLNTSTPLHRPEDQGDGIDPSR